MALWLWWGSLWVWNIKYTQKVFQPAGWTWASSPTKDPSRSICFRLLKANRVTFPHPVPFTTHLCQTTNIDLPGGELVGCVRTDGETVAQGNREAASELGGHLKDIS